MHRSRSRRWQGRARAKLRRRSRSPRRSPRRRRQDFDSRSRSPRTGVNAIPIGCPESEEETEARVWILHSDAAKVIGRNGRALREIEHRTHTRIRVSKEEDMLPTKERSVDIFGSRADQDAAVDLILDVVLYCREDGGQVIKDVRNNPSPGREEPRGDAQRVITVLPAEVGKVLGRKGETVRLIERDSGAKVELDKAQGKVEIFGKKDEQDRAVELLLAEVHFAKDADGTVLKDEPRPKQRAETESELPSPAKIWVRDREAGRVIGRGGETVREVMEKSGADIKVQKAEEMAPGSKNREIKLIGSKEQQDEAIKLILNEVSWAKGPDGVLKGEASQDEEKVQEEDVKEKEKEEQEKEFEKKEKAKPRRFRETARELNRPKSGPARWVCATCGGDHRTKECPHATGILGVGVQLGMQMGLQAMGLPTPPIMPFPGHVPMGHSMPLPGMSMGLPGMVPGMKPMGVLSQSSSSSSSESPAGTPESPESPRGLGLAPKRRRRVKKHREGTQGVLRRRRREERDLPGELPTDRRRGEASVTKKKIVMSDL
ncbi:unnamed protein product [Effrenium voratum]|uniref:K Homology domain-containing protein n=1 Tax=Effrenium voratum TaxID=2562239 RepID=A0AA36JEH7_9DINO|nr:unnamed protein product [Effrenium voratum]